jgi:tetratricopeptide (TPR) repeat protein
MKTGDSQMSEMPEPTFCTSAGECGLPLQESSVGIANLQLGTGVSWNFSGLFFAIVLAIFSVFCSAQAMAEDEAAELTALLAKEPNRVDLLKQRAVVFRLEGMGNDSLADLNRARQLDPNDREVLLQRGLTLSALRRDAEAEAELTAFLKLESGVAQAVALMERGSIRARTGRPDLAIADLTAAIGVRPALDLYLARGNLQESTGQSGAAAAGYQEAIARLGPVPALTEALLRVQTAQGQYQSALSVVDQQLARAPVKTTLLLRRAEILSASGQEAQAQTEISKAFDEANRALNKRITGLNLLLRAKVLMAMGRFEEARSDLENCLSLAPTFAQCSDLLNQL